MAPLPDPHQLTVEDYEWAEKLRLRRLQARMLWWGAQAEDQIRWQKLKSKQVDSKSKRWW